MLDYDAFRRSRRRRGRRDGSSGSGSACTSSPRRWARRRLHTEGATVRIESSGKVMALSRHHVARPERRDHDGADRRRHARRRLRRRHRRAGRHAVHALRARDRRQRAPRSSPAARPVKPPSRGARQGRCSRRARDGGGARDLEIVDSAGLRAGHTGPGRVDARGRDGGVPVRGAAAAGARSAGSRPPSGSVPNPFPTWSNATHLCVSRSTPRRAFRRCSATSSPRTAAPMINPQRRRRPDLRWRRPGPRRCAARGLRLRR